MVSSQDCEGKQGSGNEALRIITQPDRVGGARVGREIRIATRTVSLHGVQGEAWNQGH